MDRARATWRSGSVDRPQFGVVMFEDDAVSAPTLHRLLDPMGVDVQTARIGFPGADEDAASFADRLCSAAATILPSAAPAVMGFACTTGAIQLGPDRLRAALGRPGAAPEPVTPIGGLIDALHTLDARRIAIISPYAERASSEVASYIEGCGIAVSRLRYFDAGNQDIAMISSDSIGEAATDCCASERPHALYLSCTGLRATPLIATLEAELGIAVLTSLQVMAWSAATRLGITPRGTGRLFARSA